MVAHGSILHGNLKIKEAASGADDGNQYKANNPELKLRGAIGAAGRNKGAMSDKEEVRMSTGRGKIRGAGVLPGHRAKRRRHRGDATGEGRTGNDDGETQGPPEKVSRSSVGTRYLGNGNEETTCE
jgi:hypothetical protein